MSIRLTTWNIKWLGQLLKGYSRTLTKNSKRVTSASGKALQRLQKEQIADEIRRIDPDILCIQEGPSTGNVGRLETFCADYLDNRWSVITRPAGEPYLISGSQGIFYLVRSARIDALSPRLLANSAWIEATEVESRIDVREENSGEHLRTWPINHPHFKPDGGETLPEPADEDGAEDDGRLALDDRTHKHYRHPQVLVCDVDGHRLDIIGAHLKSKFGGDDYEDAGKLLRKPNKSQADIRLIKKVEQTGVESRIKLSTEAQNVRYYIESRFRNEPFPAVFLVGDLNDGVGKEAFERKYLFHDLISNLQGDVFFARRFLNHALFDYGQTMGENHRWTTTFTDAWDPHRPTHILLDHILFTQAVVGGQALERTGMRVRASAGRVEHEIHNLVNAVFDREEDFTSDHRPVSVDISTMGDPVA